MLGEILLKSTNYKHNPLVGKEELEVEVPITLVLNTDEVREPYCLEAKAEAEDSERGRTKGTKWGKINSNDRRERRDKDALKGEVEDDSRERDKDNVRTSDKASPCNAYRHTLPT